MAIFKDFTDGGFFSAAYRPFQAFAPQMKIHFAIYLSFLR